MKTGLTVEQSNALITLGVPASKARHQRLVKASEATGVPNLYRKGESYAVFGLSDLLDMLPKEIKIGITTWNLNIDYPPINQVAARYVDPDDIDNDLQGFMCDELIDALFELTMWCIRHRHLKF